MANYVELRRHTDADGDVLTPEGVKAAQASVCLAVVRAKHGRYGQTN